VYPPRPRSTEYRVVPAKEQDTSVVYVMHNGFFTRAIMDFLTGDFFKK